MLTVERICPRINDHEVAALARFIAYFKYKLTSLVLKLDIGSSALKHILLQTPNLVSLALLSDTVDNTHFRALTMCAPGVQPLVPLLRRFDLAARGIRSQKFDDRLLADMICSRRVPAL